MTTVKFDIPVKPIPKGRPRLGMGKVYTPKRTKAFEDQVRVIAKAAFNSKGIKPFDKAVCVYIRFCFKSKDVGYNYTTPSDIDNLQKSLFDGLNGIAYKDDKQIVFVWAEKVWAEEDCVRVLISDNRLDEQG